MPSSISSTAIVVAAPPPNSCTSRFAVSIPSRIETRSFESSSASTVNWCCSDSIAIRAASSPCDMPPQPSATTKMPERSPVGSNPKASSLAVSLLGQRWEKNAARPPANATKLRAVHRRIEQQSIVRSAGPSFSASPLACLYGLSDSAATHTRDNSSKTSGSLPNHTVGSGLVRSFDLPFLADFAVAPRTIAHEGHQLLPRTTQVVTAVLVTAILLRSLAQWLKSGAVAPGAIRASLILDRDGNADTGTDRSFDPFSSDASCHTKDNSASIRRRPPTFPTSMACLQLFAELLLELTKLNLLPFGTRCYVATSSAPHSSCGADLTS